MKRKLLNIFHLAFFGLYSLNQASAQEFDYNSGLISDTEVKATLTNASNPGITQNGIKLSFDPDDLSNSNNSLSVGLATGVGGATFTRIQFNHATRGFFILTSPTAIKRFAIQYRGASDSGTGAMMITYGSSKTDPFIKTHTFPAVTGLAPGVINYINFAPEEDVKYIKIQRSGSLQSQLFRVSASTTSTTFTLPLDLLDFSAKVTPSGNSVDLNWRTTNEISTKEFIIERRTEETSFKEVGRKNSYNTYGIHNYNFTDYNISSGNIYYRLKQIDQDGQFKYSDIVTVKVKSNLTLSAFPNPTTDVLNLAHATAKNASVRILNLNGQTLIIKSLDNGSSSTSINTSSFNSGIYILVYNNNGEESTLKFIKK
ncbi:T9SS type A sorting domain-containing protein [Pedobacter glucosidilyticus]|uniref:T9SS type A sorting domain-containing protein n=1 Tax=Pedobacter glucosidilyticus TaxID=1122941 RepID=UPI0026E9C774|nr:T9SS type A sorting domain-containing protein [Pedobacter glucosidilyticus]